MGVLGVPWNKDHRLPDDGATAGTIYGMVKTTVYLPKELKRSLERLAADRGESEAQMIREAIASFVSGAARPRPRGGLFSSDDSLVFARNVDEALKGFGER